ncbi:hypothetical protein AB656_03925 [Bifidobacterium actinocoloniiforme DSM 22766]|nr:hypothetical protein AB656_03925 [Bifidobacterium actinocoloniiforme DSM 22766]
MQTAGGGDRIQLSQTLIQGTTTGGLQGIGDDPTHPYWLIWGDHDEDGLVSRLMMGTSTQQPEISIVRGQQGRNNVGLTADRVDIVGRQIVGIEGDVALDGRSIYAPDRRVYQWVSSWTGRPGYPGGTWYTENTASLTVRSPGQGRWYVLDMGERITGPGEGFLLAVIRKNGENIATHVVSSSATPGGQTDNYSASRRFWLPDGVYQITVYFKYFGDCQVSGGDVYLCYTDPQVSGWFARYVFLTEC